MNLNMVIFSYVIFLKTVKVDQANSSNAGVGSAAKTVRQREEDPLDDEVVIIENNNGNQTSFKVELMDGSMKSIFYVSRISGERYSLDSPSRFTESNVKKSLVDEVGSMIGKHVVSCMCKKSVLDTSTGGIENNGTAENSIITGGLSNIVWCLQPCYV
ncbi:hypothetical protein V6N12_020136 [Hibiscus sabdariffa]|uniref:Uncharacterized protein n=1 Tax=Hibiscus sabdariffa TaxID=183260 RepID=A0ABR1ZHT5_9ROSI